MEPIIYKPGAYKTPSIYKGAGGVYNGNGVYNDGAGGGDAPNGWHYIECIKKVNNTTSRFYLNIAAENQISNADLEFELTFSLYEQIDGGLLLCTTTSNGKCGFCTQFSSGHFDRFYTYNGYTGSYSSMQNFVNMPYTQKIIGTLKNNTLSCVSDEYSVSQTKTMYQNGTVNRIDIFNGTPNAKGKSIIYGLQIKKGDNIYFDIIPIEKDDFSELNFYDKVTGTIFTLSGNQTDFEKG